MIALGLGSNLGNRLEYIKRAIILLTKGTEPLVKNAKLSNLYESEAILPPNAGPDWNRDYLNLVLVGESSLSPEQFLKEAQRIEKSLGRVKKARWAPREIDIDILAWNSEVIHSETLDIPHPALLERKFTLLPLAEVSPDWKFPVEGPFKNRTVKELAERWRGKESSDFQLSHDLLKPGLVGIINVTPDSFSDGGQFCKSEDAVKWALSLVEAGAEIIDLGAESTRPGAETITPDEEWKRLEPVIQGIQSQNSRVKLSIDTRNPITAVRALTYGVDWINDVSGVSSSKMAEVIASSEADVVLMHSLTVPADRKKVIPEDKDPVTEVLNYADAKLKYLETFGIGRERIIFDPGIGFGKTPQQSVELIRRAKEISSWTDQRGIRLLYGHSRKSFLSLFTDRPFVSRNIETLASSILLAQSGVDYLRIHDVAIHKRALKIANALR